MKRFGLIGSGISHSQSPALFKEAFGDKWPYDLLDGKEFEPLWEKFLTDYSGINITSPFKEKAFMQVAALTADGRGALTGPALKAGAINIAVKQDKQILGANSDFDAVILSVAEALFPGIIDEFRQAFGKDLTKRAHQFVKQQFSQAYPGIGAQALVVGCGGAGRTAAVAAAELGYDVILANRTKERAADFALSLPEYGFAVCSFTELRPAVQASDLIIYATSGPGSESDAVLDSLSVADFERIENHRPKILIEANYKNPTFCEKRLLTALKAGTIYVDGTQWLGRQALAGFPVLTGEAY